MRTLPAALLLLLTLVPALAYAQASPLYEAVVSVPDQSEAARAAAAGDALAAVLVKLTGDRGVAGHGELRSLFSNPVRLMQQFRYERDADGSLTLRARFNEGALQRALIDAGIPMWGRERPVTLAWLAYDDGFERGYAESGSPPGLLEAAQAAADARGLPIVSPLLDLQDRSALPFTDLWGGFDGRIIDASRRYAANAVLVGRVYRVDERRWAARWTLHDDDGSEWVDTGPGELADTVGEGFHWLADRYARSYALAPSVSHDGRTRVAVAGIARVGDYASVMRYLESLSPVSSVALDSIDRDEVTFALELRGSPQQLAQAIALGSRLTPLDGGEVTLRYAVRR